MPICDMQNVRILNSFSPKIYAPCKISLLIFLHYETFLELYFSTIFIIDATICQHPVDG